MATQLELPFPGRNEVPLAGWPGPLKKMGHWLGERGQWGQNLKNWGLTTGAFGAAREGMLSSFGMYKNAAGKYSWMGGTKILGKGGMLRGLGFAGGMGMATFAATGSPLAGAGAAGAGLWLHGRRGGAGFGAFKMAAPIFTGFAAYEGWKNEGLWGAVKGTAKSAMAWAAQDVIFKGAAVAFKGTALANAAHSVMRALPIVGTVAALGYGAYKATEYLAERGHRAMRSEFMGDMRAFQTEPAYTMRQRSLQEISRSHTNARTVLGNEAQLMHFS